MNLRAISSGFFLAMTRWRNFSSSELERGPVVLGRGFEEVSSKSWDSSMVTDSMSDSRLAVAAVERESVGEIGLGMISSRA